MADETGMTAGGRDESSNPEPSGSQTPPDLGGVSFAPPLSVPPKPPVIEKMPPAPETHLDLTVKPPPDYASLVAATKLKPKTGAATAPVVSDPASPAGTHGTVRPPETSAHARVPQPEGRDLVAESVGLVRPEAKAPDPLRNDIQQILKDVKLPEKTDFKPSGEPSANISKEKPSLQELLTPHTAPEPVMGPAQVPAQEVFHEHLTIEPVHTLKQDLQHVVREQKISVVKAVALEQEKKRPARIDAAPEAKSSLVTIVLSIAIFVVLGLGALGGVYYVAMQQEVPAAQSQSESMVFAEQHVTFPLGSDSGETNKAQLSQARGAGGNLGSILHITPTLPQLNADGTRGVRAATLSEFFDKIGAHPPDSLIRALGDEFFFGVHTVDKNAPVLVINVTSYDRAFDGMLTWEKTMNADLSPIFMRVPRLKMGDNGLQTERTFIDRVIRNYDVRALLDDSGEIQLYYSFPTRNLLIIAESPYTFTETLNRLQASRRL